MSSIPVVQLENLSTAVIPKEGGTQLLSTDQIVRALAQKVFDLEQQSAARELELVKKEEAFTQELHTLALKTRMIQIKLDTERTARQAAEKRNAHLETRVREVETKIREQMTLRSQKEAAFLVIQAQQGDAKKDQEHVETESAALKVELDTARREAESAKREVLQKEIDALFYELTYTHFPSWWDRNVNCLHDKVTREFDRTKTNLSPQTWNQKMGRYIELHKQLGLSWDHLTKYSCKE